jgi:hypothetical protein
VLGVAAALWHHLPPLAIGAVSTGVPLGAAIWTRDGTAVGSRNRLMVPNSS